VALTFDDGPDPRYTPQVLDILAEHGITATFCLIGAKARRFPALVRRITAAGHVLANHSMTHADLITLPMPQVAAEIAEASAAISDADAAAPLRFFRAPFGNWTTPVRVAAMELGLQPLDWSVNTCDWATPGVDKILAVVERDLRPGGVVLMHDSAFEVFEEDANRGQTVTALGKLTRILAEKGYAFDVPSLPAERAS
jgi:chitooligosaccharide deacetylase